MDHKHVHSWGSVLSLVYTQVDGLLLGRYGATSISSRSKLICAETLIGGHPMPTSDVAVPICCREPPRVTVIDVDLQSCYR